jgi:hypothetical protein
MSLMQTMALTRHLEKEKKLALFVSRQLVDALNGVNKNQPLHLEIITKKR